MQNLNLSMQKFLLKIQKLNLKQQKLNLKMLKLKKPLGTAPGTHVLGIIQHLIHLFHWSSCYLLCQTEESRGFYIYGQISSYF